MKSKELVENATDEIIAMIEVVAKSNPDKQLKDCKAAIIGTLNRLIHEVTRDNDNS